nr:MAG TPA: hypothetical protein [Bacteriophage sp.]
MLHFKFKFNLKQPSLSISLLQQRYFFTVQIYNFYLKLYIIFSLSYQQSSLKTCVIF